MKPYFSLIIPYYNASETIGRLITSIVVSKGTPPLEIIVVDDGSKDNFSDPANPTNKHIRHIVERRKKTVRLHIISLKTNKGPAVARNRGAEAAKGKFIVFLDSDVELFLDALANLYSMYQDDPDIVAVTGVWVKEQRTKKFFPNFKALRDWSYWINERDVMGYYFLFSTRIASIKRSVFLRIGGFDEKYAGPLVEDIELTYRIARRYAVIFAPNVRVRHEFEDFWPIAKKYFWRTYYWSKLYERRRRFDPVATTGKEAIAAISGACVLLTGFFMLLWGGMILIGVNQLLDSLFTIPISYLIYRYITILFITLVLFHLYLTRRFFWFAYKEKGMQFALKSFFVGIVLYCFILGGAVWARINRYISLNS